MSKKILYLNETELSQIQGATTILHEQIALTLGKIWPPRFYQLLIQKGLVIPLVTAAPVGPPIPPEPI